MESAETLANLQTFLTLLDPSSNLEEMLANVAQQLVDMFGVDHSGVLFFGKDDLEGEVIAEYPAQGAVGLNVPLTDYPLVDRLKVEQKPIAVLDAQNDPIMGNVRPTMQTLDIQSIVIIPLIVKNKIVGSLSLDATRDRRTFSVDELNLCHIIGNQIAVAVDYTYALEASEANYHQAQTLREIAATLSATLELDQVLERILAQLERVISYDSSSIILCDNETFRIVAARGFPDPADVLEMTFALAEKPHFQEIAQTRRPFVIPNTDNYGWEQIGPTTIKSWIGAPLVVSGQLIGLLTVDHGQPNFYSQADGELVTAFADLAAIALENARLYEFEIKQIEQELAIARQIQQGFFPKRIPHIPGWEIGATCIPARETGGDFYEFAERPDGLLGLVVGDVSGKSITAAMLMAAAQSVVQAKGSDYRSPARVMAETNRLLCDDVPHGLFVALSYALIAPDNDGICLSNGGQLDPFLVPADNQPVRLIDTPGNRLPLGIVSDLTYQETSVHLAPGDMLVFYTDGIVERKDHNNRLFGFEGVASVLEGLRGQSPQATMDSLIQATDEFANGIGPHDDVTLLVIQRQKT